MSSKISVSVLYIFPLALLLFTSTLHGQSNSVLWNNSFPNSLNSKDLRFRTTAPVESNNAYIQVVEETTSPPVVTRSLVIREINVFGRELQNRKMQISRKETLCSKCAELLPDGRLIIAVNWNRYDSIAQMSRNGVKFYLFDQDLNFQDSILYQSSIPTNHNIDADDVYITDLQSTGTGEFVAIGKIYRPKTLKPDSSAVPFRFNGYPVGGFPGCPPNIATTQPWAAKFGTDKSLKWQHAYSQPWSNEFQDVVLDKSNELIVGAASPTFPSMVKLKATGDISESVLLMQYFGWGGLTTLDLANNSSGGFNFLLTDGFANIFYGFIADFSEPTILISYQYQPSTTSSFLLEDDGFMLIGIDIFKNTTVSKWDKNGQQSWLNRHYRHPAGLGVEQGLSHAIPTRDNRILCTGFDYEDVGGGRNYNLWLMKIGRDGRLVLPDRLLGNEPKGTGIQNYHQTEYKIGVYPNPASNWVEIDIDTRDLLEAKIFDHLGRFILKCSNSRINVSNLRTGTYLIVIETKAGLSSDQIVIERD